MSTVTDRPVPHSRISPALRLATDQAITSSRHFAIQGELEMLSRVDWRDGLFMTLTQPKGCSVEHLRHSHDRFREALYAFCKRHVTEYLIVEPHASGDRHLHALTPSLAIDPTIVKD